MCRAAESRENPEVLTYRVPKGLFRLVAGKLYLDFNLE